MIYQQGTIFILQRKLANSDAGGTESPRNTLGETFRFIDGAWVWFSYSCEDEIRADGVKVWGETLIDAGLYEMKKGFWNKKGRDVVEIFPTFTPTKVFTKTYVHGGNTEKDSAGCPLIAYNLDTEKTKIFGSAEKNFTEWALPLIKIQRCFMLIENKQIVGEFNKTIQ